MPVNDFECSAEPSFFHGGAAAAAVFVMLPTIFIADWNKLGELQFILHSDNIILLG